MPHKRIIIESTNLVELRRLRSVVAPETLISDATVIANVLDADGGVVADSGSPINMAAVAGHPGTYRGRILSDADFAEGDTGTVRISAVSAGTIRIFYIDYTVVRG